MDCQRAAELMPWYLNGTLEAVERAELEQHLAECAGCRAERGEAEATLILFGGHPPAEVLVDHVLGRSELPRDLVEAHLAGCGTCAEEQAMVRESLGDLSAIETPAGAAEVVPLRRPAAPRPNWWAAAAAAAVIGLIGIGSGLWSWRAIERQEAGFAERERAAEERIAELEAEIRGFERARLNVPIHDLRPDGDALRSADAGPIRLPAVEGPPATLILNSQLDRGRQAERLELRDGEGRLLQSLEGISVAPTGSLTLSLPLTRLPRGTLRILLFAAGETEPIEIYSFELD